jgi:MFS family permease
MIEQNTSKKLILHITVLSVMLMVAGGCTLSFFSVKATQSSLMPQIEAKETIIASMINTLIRKAINAGYPQNRLTDLDKYFSAIRTENKELSYIALLQPDGTTLYISGDPCTDLGKKMTQLTLSKDSVLHFSSSNCLHNVYPVHFNNDNALFLFIGINNDYFWNAIHTDIIDLAALLIVSLLVLIEFMFFLFSKSVVSVLSSLSTFFMMLRNNIFTNTISLTFTKKTCEFTNRLNDLICQVNAVYHKLDSKTKLIFSKFTFSPTEKVLPLKKENALEGRLPLFLFVFADSLSLSFLPLYVSTLSTNVHWLPEKLIAGLPITVFMLFWAIILPFAGSISDKKGRDLPFLVGAAITIAGLIGTGLCRSFYELLFWRALCAIGYGAVFISSQGYILDTAGKDKRTQGMAMFLSAFFAGSLCGSAIGGIIAERFGFRVIFLLSAIVALLSALCVLSRFNYNKVTSLQSTSKRSFSDTLTILKDRNFLSVMFFSAIPAKICLVGFIYYTVPILLKSIGTSQGRIGQIIMGYSLPIVLFSPAIAKVADRLKNRSLFIITGGIISAFSLFVVHLYNSMYGILAGTVLLGIAHSISVSSQLVFVTDSFSKKTTIGLGGVISLFRLVERTGNILGPMIAGILIASFGFESGIAILGILTLCGTILFWFTNRFKEDISIVNKGN